MMVRVSFLCFSFLLWMSWLETTGQHHTADKPAVHGMVIFGREKIYASHLPMFRAPHDYQVIIELKMDNESKTSFVRDQQMHFEYATYTIEPEVFVLSDAIARRKAFTANIYRGHFERGGVKIINNARFEITQVLVFNHFDPSNERSEVPEYYVFGNTKEQFAIHRIKQKPDFDQIAQVSMDHKILSDSAAYTISFPSLQNVPIGISGNVVNAYSPERSVRLIFLRQVYLEFEDLQPD